MQELPLLFSMGLLGGLHCIGMCGGLVGALALGRPGIWWSGLAVYQLGRVTSYMLLGLVAGLAGLSLLHVWGASMQSLLALLAGIVMLLFGLNLAGLMPDVLARATNKVATVLGLSRLAYELSRHGRLHGWFTLGMANGFLPCGLVYSALSLALESGQVGMAVGMMGAFGLGTLPAMMLAPMLLRKGAPELRGKLLRIAGLLLCLVGFMTLLRGLNVNHMG